jgi:branched-subunit amino acid ABC-type transport system permease component
MPISMRCWAVCFSCAFQSYFIYLEGAHAICVSIFGGVEHFRGTSIAHGRLGLSWTATVWGKHMSQNQIIGIVAAVVILIAIISWVAIRRGTQEATSQPPQPAPSQQQTPPQPQQP